jgi:tetratricopeptide (TPR) repeat protein
MKLRLRVLMAGVAGAALLGACATVPIPGIADGNGCRTVYVFRPGIGEQRGVVQPVSTCGGLPRDRLESLTVERNSLTSTVGQIETASFTVSPQADATKPAYAPAAPYSDAMSMIENGDMAAFMARVHKDFSDKKNSGAWGYLIIDELAGGDIAGAQAVLDAMATKPPAEMLSFNHMRPWVLAFGQKPADAQAEMAKLGRILPGATLPGHKALLAEGIGDTAAALAVYQQVPDTYDPPKPEQASTPGYLTRAIAFNGQRMLKLRQAELLRALNRDPEAINVLTALSAAAPDDSYIKDRLEKTKKGEDRRKVRTLTQSMALAISDEADVIEERQAIMGMMVGRGGRIPFNQLLSSLRQSALLLDPDNGDLRLQEVGALYQGGHFEAALRIAQIGNPQPAQGAAIASTAGLAALELGSPETLEAMTNKALRVDSSPEAKLAAAGALTEAGLTDRALKLIDQAVKEGLREDRKVAAQLARGQAHLQAGDVTGAVKAARDARALEDDDDTQQFLASMLVKSPQRAEGLQIMRDMLARMPGNTGLMNNFGYSLIDGYASEAELEEGFRLLKEASRMTPDEPNLLDSIGWAYYLYGDFREAHRYLELALAAYKPFAHWELNDHMGDIQWRLGDQEAARKSWAEAAASRPPVNEIATINAKLKNGLTTPAPVRKDPPDVPRVRGRSEKNDI